MIVKLHSYYQAYMIESYEFKFECQGFSYIVSSYHIKFFLWELPFCPTYMEYKGTTENKSLTLTPQKIV